MAIVDTNASARLFASACLKQDGHEVLELEPSSVYEVLSALRDTPVDLMLTDFIMQDCPGLSLVRACREDPLLKDLKIIVLTAFGDKSLAAFLRANEKVHYLSKPVSPNELVKCVNLFLHDELEIDPGWALACRGTVAIVDDSRLCRVMHADCLHSHGFRPLAILPEDLTSVLEALQEALPDLLILDFLMPAFRGDALIRALRASASEKLRELPVLLVTAHSSLEPMEFIVHEGGVEIVQKPVDPQELAARVEMMIQERHK